MKLVVCFLAGIFILLLMFILFFLIPSPTNNTVATTPSNMDVNAVINETQEISSVRYVNHFFVNGEKVTYSNVEIHKGYATIPLVKFLTTSGYNIQWISTDVAIINIDEEKYELDLESLTLRQPEDDFNYFSSVYGDYVPVRKREEKELLIDTLTLIGVTQLLGSRAKVTINGDDVFITWKEKM